MSDLIELYEQGGIIKRCVNYDWVEVCALERTDLIPNASYYIKRGWEVDIRQYGTRVYEEMFTLKDNQQKFIEVRRNPLSKKSQGGILQDNLCHIRLANRTCYMQEPIQMLKDFLELHHYTNVKLSRLDICLDFNVFDNGLLLPNDFIQQYLKGYFAKIHQTKFCAHGADKWNNEEEPIRDINSMKWGSPSSNINTKLYDKSLELSKEGHDKPYIRQWWAKSNLQDDMLYHVWRIEFSISSQAKKLREKKEHFHVKLTLDTIDNRDKLLYLFYGLYEHYFDFRFVEYITKDNKRTVKRKDRCQRILLLDTQCFTDHFVAGSITPYSDDKRAIEKAIAKVNDLSLNKPYKPTSEEERQFVHAKQRLETAKDIVLEALKLRLYDLKQSRNGSILLQRYLNRDNEGQELFMDDNLSFLIENEKIDIDKDKTKDVDKREYFSTHD